MYIRVISYTTITCTVFFLASNSNSGVRCTRCILAQFACVTKIILEFCLRPNVVYVRAIGSELFLHLFRLTTSLC